MDKIVAPIRPADKGPAVANFQQAMLFIVEKRELSLASHTLAKWRQALAPELAQQSCGQRTPKEPPQLSALQHL